MVTSRRRLETLERRARNLKRRLGLIGPTDPAGPGDDIEVVSHNTETVLTLTVRGVLATNLKVTLDAIDRIEAGTYGKCCECGEPIHPARLFAIPEADLCILCQARAENFAKLAPAWNEED